MSTMTRIGALTVTTLLTTTLVSAQSYYLAVDVPTEVDGWSVPTETVSVRSTFRWDPVYTLPAGVEISALHYDPAGLWTFTPRTPVDLGGTIYTPADVVATDGVSFFSIIDGDAAGLPPGVGIDAIMVRAVGGLVISLDAPADWSGFRFMPGDLIRLGASIQPYWIASSNAVPASVNVVGAHETAAGLLLLTFDVPVNLGGFEYFPGQIVQWESGVGFGLHAAPPGWPASSQLRDFSMLPDAGEVPDGGAGETPLLLGKSGADITLSWGDSCLSDGDYAVYEGLLGSWSSRSPAMCSTGGATSATVATPANDMYYLIVSNNNEAEGSYGRDGFGLEREQRPGYCYPQAVGTCPAP